MIKKALLFLKKDIVLTVSAALAVVSCFFVIPSPQYFGYIDYRVLALLLSLMLVVAGLGSAGISDFIANKLIKYAKTARSLAAVLVFLCFFSSMLITNDVALITFVPLAIMLLGRYNKLLIPVIVLQTVAANLGSMLTPLGNPQNLYLYSVSMMSITDFLKITLPYTFVSFILLAVSLFFIKPEKLSSEVETPAIHKADASLWVVMFIVCILAVLRTLHYAIALVLVILAALLRNKKLLATADYGLLFTFVFFFIFVGNIKNIPEISGFLSQLTSGYECDMGIVLSQVISNVPAAMLLSGFTGNYSALLVGVNLGGLGTLIASMASLISYKLYCKTPCAEKGRFLAFFTAVNIIYLVILRIFCVLQ